MRGKGHPGMVVMVTSNSAAEYSYRRQRERENIVFLTGPADISYRRGGPVSAHGIHPRLTRLRSLTAATLCIAGFLFAGLGTHRVWAGDEIPDRALPAFETPEWFSLRTGLGWGSQTLGFDISKADLSESNLSVSPNTPLHWVVGAGWRRLGIVGRIKLPATIGNPEEQGTTEYSNIQIQYFGDRVAVDLALQQHEGMYISNADSFREEIPDPILPDLTLTTVGLTAMWVTNENHSLATAYKLNALPSRSTVSGVLMGSAGFVGIEAPGGPARKIPAAAGSVWDDNVYIFTRTITAGGGIAANLVYRRFFFAPLVTLGLGVQHGDYLIGSIQADTDSLVPMIAVRFSTGYNGPTWFWAMVGSLDLRHLQTPYLTATQGSQLIEILVGRRFTGRRWRGTQGA